MNRALISFVSTVVITLSLLLTHSLKANFSQVQTGFEIDELAIFHNQPVFSLPTADINPPPKILGNTTDDKVIYVDLANQRLYAFEGNTMIYSFLVSTGKWGRTPTGTFTIANKFRYVKMSGGSKTLRTYYYLPNVPYTMFFGNSQIPASRGFALHGTYWHDNFGHPMSHGCVNMKTSEAALVYYWADPQLPDGKHSTVATPNNPGTKIIIYGTAPKS